MSQEEVVRWTCDRCGSTAEQPDRPESWSTVGGRDVCFECMKSVNAFIYKGRPDVAALEKLLSGVVKANVAIAPLIRRILRITTGSEKP